MDPFNPMKLMQVLRRESAQSSANTSLIASELNRRKEPLEAEPLDAMTMVGSLDKKGVPTALVRVGTLLYQVRAGNYLGQNYGKVTRITETDRKSTRLNSSHLVISYAVFCLKKK